MNLTKEQILRLREIELDLLKEFIRVCDALNLSYFAVEGTLLGAVRHGGFIPWDDDIDVGMLRKDYEIFLQKAPDLLNKEFFLQTNQSDPDYLQIFAKLRRNDTAFVETTVKDLNIHHGVYIDIFPFDFFPEGKGNQMRYSFKNLMYRYRVRYSYYIPEDHTFSLKNIVRRGIYGFSLLYAMDEKTAIQKQIDMHKNVKPSLWLVNSGGPWGNREKAPISVFTDLILMKFEGIKIQVPRDFDTYLSNTYGDYRQLPPVSQQVPHHYISYLSFDESYRRNDKNE